MKEIKIPRSDIKKIDANKINKTMMCLVAKIYKINKTLTILISAEREKALKSNMRN